LCQSGIKRSLRRQERSPQTRGMNESRTEMIGDNQNRASLRRLYPDLNDEELDRVGDSWDRYISIMLRIYDRIRGDPEELARLRALTASGKSSIMIAGQSASSDCGELTPTP
jgi:hypothetical protein